MPTLVEVKQSSDSRIRREVVGQMLDYAANAVVRWPVEHLRARLLRSPDAEARLESFLDSGDVEAFWASVKANLERGRIRMVFVADEIPPELRRIVEFLAAQMRNAEVFAVEVRNFEGGGERALVPRLVSAPKTPAANDAAPERQWDEGSFFEELERRAARCVPVARALWTWGKKAAAGFWYGKGSKRGSCYPEFFFGGKKTWLFAMRTDGTLEVQFIYLKSLPPFHAEEKRRELAGRLNSIPGLSIAEDRISARPSVEMQTLAEENAVARFLEVMDWVIGEVRRA